jgi:hypothetical protein
MDKCLNCGHDMVCEYESQICMQCAGELPARSGPLHLGGNRPTHPQADSDGYGGLRASTDRLGPSEGDRAQPGGGRCRYNVFRMLRKGNRRDTRDYARDVILYTTV